MLLKSDIDKFDETSSVDKYVFTQTGGTPLQIAVVTSRLLWAKFLIDRGADVNAVFNGASTLSIALRVNGLFYDVEIIRVLLEVGANANHVGAVITPLQSWAQAVGKAGAPFSRHVFELLELLLEAGADVNGVGSDEAVIASITYDYHGDGERHEDNRVVQDEIRGRGTGLNYDTALRILEGVDVNSTHFPCEKGRIECAKELLKDHGARSLHLFLAKGFPGYVGEDMQEFAMMSTQNGAQPIHR
jgi:ankyrin repeat protein